MTIKEKVDLILDKHYTRSGQRFHLKDIDVYGNFVSVEIYHETSVLGARGYYVRRNKQLDKFNIDVGLGIAINLAIVRFYREEKT